MPDCRWEEVDGTPVRVRGDGPMTDRDREMLAEIVRAAKAHVIVQDDEALQIVPTDPDYCTFCGNSRPGCCGAS